MATIIDSDAQPTIDTLLDGFKKPDFDLRVVETRYVDYNPIAGPRHTQVLRYIIPKSHGNFVKAVDKMILALDLKITNSKKNGLPPLDINSGPCQNFLFSVFSGLRISYGNTTVLHLENYHLYSYLRMLLTCNAEDFKTRASNRGFIPMDPEEEMDTVPNKAWTGRKKLFGGEITTPGPNKGKFSYSPVA